MGEAFEKYHAQDFVILGVNVDAMHEDVREREAKEEFFRDLDVALVALTRA